MSTGAPVMHGSGRCGQVLKVDDAKRCSSHSSILELLAGVHSNGSATGRTGSVIFFPINAPGMGRFKLFDLVGCS